MLCINYILIINIILSILCFFYLMNKINKIMNNYEVLLETYEIMLNKYFEITNNQALYEIKIQKIKELF